MTTTPPRPPTRAIFFDLDDTLVDTASADARAYEAARRTLATTRDDARDDDETDDDARSREDAATRAVERYKRAMVTRTPWDETRREHVWKTRERMWVEAAAAGDDDDARGGRAAARANVIFRDVRLETLKIRERVREGIARLRSRGIGVGIITNGHEIVQREKLAACGAYACVDGKNILVGGEEVLAGRGEKPCASIFREACARVGVGPGEAVHVGDSWRADARGAPTRDCARRGSRPGDRRRTMDTTPNDCACSRRSMRFLITWSRRLGRRTRGVDSRSDAETTRRRDDDAASRNATVDLFRDEWCVYCTVLYY